MLTPRWPVIRLDLPEAEGNVSGQLACGLRAVVHACFLRPDAGSRGLKTFQECVVPRYSWMRRSSGRISRGGSNIIVKAENASSRPYCLWKS